MKHWEKVPKPSFWTVPGVCSLPQGYAHEWEREWIRAARRESKGSASFDFAEEFQIAVGTEEGTPEFLDRAAALPPQRRSLCSRRLVIFQSVAVDAGGAATR